MNTFNFRMLSLSLALAAMLVSVPAMASNHQHGADMMNLSPEKQELVKKLHEDFYNNTKSTRQELISKKHELDAQLYSATPDEKKIQALTKEIADLRATLYNARIALKSKLIKEGVTLGHGGYGHGMKRGMGRGACGGQAPCGNVPPCGGGR